MKKIKHHHWILSLLSGFSVAASADSGTAKTVPPELPEAIASFGAIISGNHLYVYGGHVGEEHDHSKDNLRGSFHRIPTGNPAAWEALEGGTPLQGLAMVAWKSEVLRIGGMLARNAPGEEDDLHSQDSVASFDTRTGAWSAQTPLPKPVSSLDAVVVGDTVYVLGGWTLSGDGRKGEWRTHGWKADLTARPLVWQSLPEMPEPRRAGAAATLNGEIYWMGGMGSNGRPAGEVFIFNPADNTWRTGPALPFDGRMKGFGVSATYTDDAIYLSGWSRALYRLSAPDTGWEKDGTMLNDRRIFHRLLIDSNRVAWVIAGASSEGHVATTERVLLPALPPLRVSSTNWPSFRGDGRNYSPCSSLPKAWGVGTNALFRAGIEGYGQSSPVVWDRQIYLTSAIGDKKETYAVTCLDAVTGEKRWTASLTNSLPLEISGFISVAAPSPCVDGAGVYAFFESADLTAFDHDGTPRWERRLGAEYGIPAGNHGLGGSMVQDPHCLYVLVDHSGPGYLVAIDKATGKTRWKVDRPKRVSWSTPILDRDRILISSNGRVEERRTADGSLVWGVEGWEKNTVASPLVAGPYVISAASERRNSAAILRRSDGERPEKSAVWTALEPTASFASPILVNETLVLCSKAGIAYGVNPATGEMLWEERLPNDIWATPLVTDAGVYFCTKGGESVFARVDPAGFTVLKSSMIPVEKTRVYAVAAAHDILYLRLGSELLAFRSPPGL